ncbi:hypothetical protein F5148DRAFT_1223616 [Russula earlei]|uniref:Uncharacterized protein n=1 Tax=Russula earlei TaxID=71964 RepID=A0ACC0U2P1_9AGAM|nr:hypothetical protein F5148DRAFT_1223616 [Russula earlei]
MRVSVVFCLAVGIAPSFALPGQTSSWSHEPWAYEFGLATPKETSPPPPSSPSSSWSSSGSLRSPSLSHESSRPWSSYVDGPLSGSPSSSRASLLHNAGPPSRSSSSASLSHNGLSSGPPSHASSTTSLLHKHNGPPSSWSSARP